MTALSTIDTAELMNELRRRRMAVITFSADDLASFFRSGHPDWRFRPDGYDDEVADWFLREGRDALESNAWSAARVKLIDHVAEIHAECLEDDCEDA